MFSVKCLSGFSSLAKGLLVQADIASFQEIRSCMQYCSVVTGLVEDIGDFVSLEGCAFYVM